MAIKGKKRSRGRPRTVATAPRPFLVPPRTPLLRRKSVQLALIVLLEAAIAGIALGYRVSRDNAQHVEQVREFGTRVDAVLQGTGVAQPVPGAVLVLPQMGQAIAELRTGEANVGEVRRVARSWQEAATNAAQQVSGMETDAAALKAARLSMSQGLQIYASVAANLQVATEVRGRVQQRLVDNLGTELQVAAEVFDTGYQLLQEERRKTDLLEAPSVGGFPGGEIPGVPGGVPGLPGGG